MGHVAQLAAGEERSDPVAQILRDFGFETLGARSQSRADVVVAF